MPLRTLKINPESKLHEDLVAKLSSRFTLAKSGQETRHEKWRMAEERVLAYVPETEADSVRKSKRAVDGEPKYTTMMIPYTYAMLMSSHTYWSSVFFARNPVHQFAGRHGEDEQQVQAVEALIAYQVEVGEMLGPYYLWLYDAGKYGHGILGHYWTVETIHYGEMVEMDLGDGKGPQLFQATHEVEGYRGNRSYNCSPYDWWHDPRVALTRFQSGEFCIARKRLGWSDILARRDEGFFINIDKIAEHKGPDKGATDGSGQLPRPDFMKSFINDSKDEQTPAGATFLEFYINLIPKHWGLGDSNYAQKWCITITEDMGLIVGASPLGYYHGKFPFDVLEPEIEGYGIFNRGIPEIMEAVQNTMDWLLNTHFYNVRAAVNNQFIIDPSKIVTKDVANSGKPGFVWRLRPEAYGADITKMFHQVQVQDVTRSHVGDIGTMLQIGEKALGVNDQMMGALSMGGRKTATEVRTSTGFGVNRQKTITEYMSATGFSPHATKLLQASQQFYDVEGKLRIVGDLAQTAGPKFMKVTPEMIAGFYSPVPVDGALPIDRMAQANLWKEILIGATRMPPQIAAQYDFAKIFAWMAQLASLKNINQMKTQVVPDEVAAQQAQMGNVVPLRALAGPQPGVGNPDASTTAGLNALNPPAGAY